MMKSLIRGPDSAIRILIVDDEPYICDILSRWLGGEGYQCEIATNAEEAWKLLEHGSFSLAVCDIKMPGKSGIELLTRVKGRFAHELAVIMVTGVDDRETAIQALELGAYGYVVKPFERNEVVINVVNALERRRLVLESLKYEQRLEEQVREQTRDIRTSQEEICLRLMAAQEYHSDETSAHVKRIGLYSEEIAREMGCPVGYGEMLRLAAPMHDLGKISTPDSILMKPGGLTKEEFEIMMTHTTIGARILDGSGIPLLDLACDIALYHHERWDGSGYPKGLSEGDIPEAARIVAILDVYDALVHDRVYRPALSEEEALEIITDGRGSHFDPRIADVFMKVLPELRRMREKTKEEAR